MIIAIVVAIVAVGTLLVYVLVAGRRARLRERAAKADGSFARQFVWVENDGSIRELTPEEVSYLNTEFHPADGARPYIKPRYSSRPPDGRMCGFLLRRKIPRNATVRG
jgi:type II secretory pathway pseudopilin PulG